MIGLWTNTFQITLRNRALLGDGFAVTQPHTLEVGSKEYP